MPWRRGKLPLPEATVRSEKFVFDFGERSVHLDPLLPMSDHRAGRQVQGRVFDIVTRHLEKLRFIVTIDQSADIGPIKRASAHGTGFARRDQRARPKELRRIRDCSTSCQLDFGVMHGVDICLAHQNRVVRADQNCTERVMAVCRPALGNDIGCEKVGDHLVMGHDEHFAS